MRRKKLLKTLSCLIIAISVSTSICMPAFADTVQYKISVPELRNKVESQLGQFNSTGVLGYHGELGVLYNLDTVARESLWVDFMNNNTSLKLDGAFVQNQNDEFKRLIDSFNASYAKDDKAGNYTPLKLDLKQNKNRFSNFDGLTKQITDYLNTYVGSLGKGQTLDQATCKKIAESHKRELMEVNKIIDDVNNTVNSINSCLPVKVTDTKNGSKLEKPADVYKPNISPYQQVFVNKDNNGILREARIINVKGLDNISPDKHKASDEILNELYKDGDPSKNKLANYYYLMFSCSAVYEPFSSHLGDEPFLRSLNFLLKNDKDLGNLYQRAMLYKKPLYLQDLADTKDGRAYGSGTATRLTLEDLAKTMDGDTSGAIVTTKDSLTKEKDSNSYMYYKNTGLESTNKDAKQNADKDAKKDTTNEQDAKKDSKKVSVYPNSATISDPQELSSPLFYWASQGPYVFNKMVMKNILKDVTHIQDFEKDGGLLFVDPFGDIVLADNTVVLPGATNPCYLKQGQNYFPYTNGFIKPYPALSAGSVNFSTQNARDDGKYVLAVENKDEKGNVIPGAAIKRDTKAKTEVMKVLGNNSLDLTDTSFPNMAIQTSMADESIGVDSMFAYRKFKFDGDIYNDPSISQWWSAFGENWLHKTINNHKAEHNGLYFLTKTLNSSVTQGSRVVLFGSNVGDLSDKDLAAIARNYYYAIMSDGNHNLQESPNGRIDEEFLATQLVPYALNGITNPQAYTKNMLTDYETYTDNSANRFVKLIKGLVKPMLDELGNVTGVLGLQNAYQSPVLGKLMVMFKQYQFYALLVLIVLVGIKFMKTTMDIFHVAALTAIVVGIMYVFVNIIPVYLPTVFNAVNNNWSKELAFSTLMVKAENYSDTYSDKTDSDGRVKMSTSSISLYKLTQMDVDALSNQLHLTKDEIYNGSAHQIDANSGLFVEGDVLKMNVDKLFLNNPIVGGYATAANGALTYQLKDYRMQSSSVDYYMPYHLIETSFINKLNQLSSIYLLSRSTLNYNGMTKDSFMVEAYMHSAPFLTPGNFDSIADTTEPEVLKQLKDAFPTNGDFLGLMPVLTSDDSKVQQTLWYQTLKQNGYIDDQAKLEQLCQYVNFNTKEFMLKNVKKFAGMSDENIIKIVSLEANMLLNQKAGTFGNEMYPMYLNYPELHLGDIMIAAFTTDYNMFMCSNYNIVDYVTNNYGWFALLGFALYLFLAFLVTWFVKLGVPVLYVILCVLMLLKFFTNRNILPLVKGYIKSCITIFLCFSAQCIAINLIHNLADTSAAVWVLLVIELLIAEILVRLVLTLFSNLSELGNDNYHKLTPWIVKVTKLNILADRIAESVNSMRKGARHAYDNMPKGFDRYRYDYDMDDDLDDARLYRRIIRNQYENSKDREHNIHDDYNNKRYTDDDDYFD